MPIVASFIAPGSPLPYFQPENPPWGEIAGALERAGSALAETRPDTLAIYSTQWIAVLDQLWQTRPQVEGLHVDENWHEYGELPFDFLTDTAMTERAMTLAVNAGVRSKGVDYDHFPVDTGTIVANHFLNPAGTCALVSTANNVYHDWATTAALGAAVAGASDALDRRVAVIGVGLLSGSFFRHAIDPAEDHIAEPEQDAWNRRMLALLEAGDVDGVSATAPEYAQAAKVDMGFKHLAFVLGALGGTFSSATVHGYGPVYGCGAAVVQLHA